MGGWTVQKRLMWIMAALLLAVWVAAPAGATSCIYRTPGQRFLDADVVFWGEAAGKRATLDGGTNYTFKVLRSLKGTSSGELAVYSRSGAGGVIIGDPVFKVGERWLVFARVHQSRLNTGPCSGSTPMQDLTAETLEQAGLGELAPILAAAAEGGAGTAEGEAGTAEGGAPAAPRTALMAAALLILGGAAACLIRKRRT